VQYSIGAELLFSEHLFDMVQFTSRGHKTPNRAIKVQRQICRAQTSNGSLYLSKQSFLIQLWNTFSH